MSVTVPSIESEIEDFDHDEPTQFMLQLMQTSIKRRMASRTKKFTKFFSILTSPIGMVVFLLIACPGLATVFTFIGINYSGYSSFLEQFVEMLSMMTGFMLAFFGFRFFTILLIPMPFTSGMLDIARTERLMLSGIIGNSRWVYINRQLELEFPAKLIRVYLSYILYTLGAFLLMSILINQSIASMLFESIKNTLVLGVLVGLLISMIISTFRAITALKLIMYSHNCSALAQQILTILWIAFWLTFGYLSKLSMAQNGVELDDFNIYTLNPNLHTLIIYGIFGFIIAYSVAKLIKGVGHKFSYPTIKSLINIWFRSKYYILYLIVGLTYFLNVVLSLRFSSIQKIPEVMLNNSTYIPVSLILIIGLAHLTSIWLKSRNDENYLKLKHLIIYIVLVLFLFVTNGVILHYTQYNSDQNFQSIIPRILSIFLTLPSIFIVADKSLLDCFDAFSGSLSASSMIKLLYSFMEAYMIIAIFPSLFARFMENIALQKPPIPKI